MSIRIITDSASDMSPAEHPALRVLPLSVTFGTDVYMDGVDIDHQRFYEMLVERDELPKTGQVNPYAFSQAIAEAREAGDEAVIITVGAKLSGTNQSARTALAEAPGGDVFVVDSNNVTLGERVLVEYALRLVDEGRSAAQIAAAVEAVRDRVVVIGLLETLEYLVRGGRLSAAAGAVGTLLNVKPVVAARGRPHRAVGQGARFQERSKPVEPEGRTGGRRRLLHAAGAWLYGSFGRGAQEVYRGQRRAVGRPCRERAAHPHHWRHHRYPRWSWRRSRSLLPPRQLTDLPYTTTKGAGTFVVVYAGFG